MANYCLDSSIVIDFLRNHENVKYHWQKARKSGNILSICPTVYYEVVRGFKIANASQRLKEFLKIYEELSDLPFDMRATEKAIDIYEQLQKEKRLIEDNDIYIAAISMVNDCTLVTANVNHFGRVEGLNFVNWRTA